jgi:hypothetical protein
MKRKIKNSREEYIARASIHHSNNDGENRHVKLIEAESNDSIRYRKAVIEESWYINFNVTDEEALKSSLTQKIAHHQTVSH